MYQTCQHELLQLVLLFMSTKKIIKVFVIHWLLLAKRHKYCLVRETHPAWRLPILSLCPCSSNPRTYAATRYPEKSARCCCTRFHLHLRRYLTHGCLFQTTGPRTRSSGLQRTLTAKVIPDTAVIGAVATACRRNKQPHQALSCAGWTTYINLISPSIT